MATVASRSEHDARPENVTSFYDPDALATSKAQFTRNNLSPSSGGVKWPFLGSIRSRGSRSAPNSPIGSFGSRPRTGEPNEIPLLWRPLFLHRRVLSIFIVLILALLAGLQTALQISEHNGSIGRSNYGNRLLWQYGIVLAFTIVATLWARVEFQASSATPWIRMLKSQVVAEKSLLLDYVSLSEPRALVKAIRGKDWLVATATTVGLLLKLVIIFSCALITPTIITDLSRQSDPSLDSAFSTSLSMRPLPAYLITAFLGLVLILVILLIALVPSQGFLPRDPTTMVGFGAVVAHSHPFVECLHGMGAATTEAIQARLLGSTYSSGAEGHEKLGDSNLAYFHIFGGKAPPRSLLPRRFDPSRWQRPVPLHGLIRLLYVVVLCTIILGFEISLRASQRYDGLRAIDGDRYYMAWTAAPALVLLLVASYLISIDWWTRLLAPFAHLSRRASFDKTIGLNLLNTSSAVALWRASVIRDVAAWAAVLGGLIAPLLVVTSAALFEPVSIESSERTLLPANDFFPNSIEDSSEDPVCTQCTNDTTMAAIILNTNTSYPPFTFADLNFPTLTLDDKIDDDSLKIAVRLTAIRPNMTCTLHLFDDIVSNLTLNVKTGDKATDLLYVDVSGEDCQADGNRTKIDVAGDSVENDIFGVGLGRTKASPQCSDWLYIWGKLEEDSEKRSLMDISALACNETVESVETDVTLQGPELRIDPTYPPVPDEKTAKNSSVAIPELDYSLLSDDFAEGPVDQFFALLLASGQIDTESSFGNEPSSATQRMQSAIVSQHGIIRAQSLNFKSRRHLSESGTFPMTDNGRIASGVDPSAPVSRAVPIVSGSLMTEKIRLRQDAIATRILQGTAGAMLVLHLVCWMFRRGPRLPRAPTTIASMTALLVDGDLLKLLPRGAQWQEYSEIKSTFGEGDAAQKFEIGWDHYRPPRPGPRQKPRGEGRFGIRMVDPSHSESEDDIEMRPIPPKKSREYLRPVERTGRVRRGRAALGTDGEQIKSVVAGRGEAPLKKKKSLGAWSGPKELVKVWWSSS